MDTWSVARESVEACLKAGVSEFVVCAGARNAALVEVLVRAEADGRIRVWRHFEERSAGFFALGRIMATGEPCAVVTTSGTAVAELLPAVVEAHYQARPLVLLTADRPERFRGTGSPQTIDQVNIFGSHAETGEIATWTGTGPFHWNLSLEESFSVPADVSKIDAPAEFRPKWPSLNVAAAARFLREDLYRGLVVCIGGLEPSEREEVFHFCHELKAPVIAEATSGLREALWELSLPDPDRILAKQRPGKVLRLGDVPSGRFWRDLESWDDVEVCSVTRTGYPGLARPSLVVRGEIDRVLRAMGHEGAAEDALDLLTAAPRARAWAEELLEAYPDSEPGLMHTLSIYTSLGSAIYLGNSLPIREWNLFAQYERPVTEVRANRGANGIDGQLSTWLGWTANTDGAWAIVGDLTALYDLSAPAWLDQLEGKSRVLVVINNGGGKIFDRLPRMKTMSERGREVMTNAHEWNFKSWAEMWGMSYHRIASIDDFDGLEPGEGTTLLELVPNESETTSFWEKWDLAK